MYTLPSSTFSDQSELMRMTHVRQVGYVVDSRPPVEYRVLLSAENATERTLPFIFRLPMHCFV